MKDPAKVAQALLDNHCREYPEWRNCAQMRSLKKRIAAAIQAERDLYEGAIQRCERTFSRNKARMWVLKILREQITG